MKLRVLADRCQGHNRCAEVAPDLFVIDDVGAASSAIDRDLTPDEERTARRAAANCPERAIVLDGGDP